MSLTASIREQVRHRAQSACEFCGITEIDAGGMLTIDHFQPRTKAGSDTLEDLIYACNRLSQILAFLCSTVVSLLITTSLNTYS
jgi:hypothetical protein